MKMAMNWRRLQVFVFAVFLVVANTHCLVACSSEPCHESRAHAQADLKHHPSCHKEQGQPEQTDAAQRCAHAPFLADYQAAAKVFPNLEPVEGLTALPIECASALIGDQVQTAVLRETSPPVSTALLRLTILR